MDCLTIGGQPYVSEDRETIVKAGDVVMIKPGEFFLIKFEDGKYVFEPYPLTLIHLVPNNRIIHLRPFDGQFES